MPNPTQTFTHKQLGNSKVIIFSHGFGVRWDAKNIIPDIIASLTGYDLIYFDYVKSDEFSNTYIDSLEEEIEIYKKALAVAEEHNYKEINLISHSLGAMVPLIVNSDKINKFIMLAPQTHIDKEYRLQRVKEKKGATLNLNGYSIIPNSDGTTKNIHIAFYNALENLNFFELINKNLSKEKVMIIAKQDEVVPHDHAREPLDPAIKIEEIDGDHNFKGESRKGLVATIKESLSVQI